MITNIKIAREKSGKLQKECADAVGITLRAWQGYEQGIREPKFEVLIKIADLFHVTTDYLLEHNVNKLTTIDKLTNEFNLSHLEQKILENYLALPENMRDSLMDFLRKSINENTDERKFESSNNKKSSLSFMKIIPLADVALSAGVGIEPLTDTSENIEVDSRQYPNADMVFKVKGDSMEPIYYDGDVVYVHSQPTLDNGQIGAFLYNGEQYLKKFVISNNGYILRSLNAEYNDIVINKNDELIIYGKVLN